MEMLNDIVEKNRENYKCYDLLKNLIENEEQFCKILNEGLTLGKITGFPEELWDKIRLQNIRRINSFEDVFRDGANIGYCTVASKQLSYSLDSCYICGGVLPILKNTPNCENGNHTWISYKNKIIDTSLMLIIDEDYAKKFGYIEENRYDPNQDYVYQAAKEWTNDININRERKH